MPFHRGRLLRRWLRKTRRLRLVAALAACVSASLSTGQAWGQTTWTGATNVFWFTNTNWDTNAVPNGIAVDVILGAPSPAIANGNVNINSLNVGAAGVLTVNSGLDFDFGGIAATTLTNAGSITVLNNSDFQLARTVNNSGSIIVTNANNLTDLEVISEGATLTGGGTITLGGTSNNSRIMGVGVNPTLTIANQTIQGRGQIGANTLGIINQANGLIDANSSGNLLTIDPSAAGMTNQGTMRASSQGVLQLNAGNFNNTGGLIEAQTASTVRLTNATLIGGTLSTSGTGLISVDAGTNSFLDNLTIAGNLEVLNNTDLGLTGTINNTGSIAVSNLNNLTDIEIQAGGATLTGGGTITLQGTSNSSRIDGVGGSTLTIANQIIQGRGQIGANAIGIVNQAGNLIHANSSGNLLTIDPSAAGNMTNQGTMRASNGGVLQLDGLGGGNFINAGGSIEAQDGSIVRLTNATVVGGTLSTSGSGLISVDSGTNSFLENLTIAGNLEVLNNTDLGFTGTINNTGSIAVSNLNNLTDIEVQAGGATLTGGGTITLQGTSNNSRIDGVGGSTLTIANQTIQGRGNIGANSIGIVNQTGNLIHANSNAVGSLLTIDPSAAGNMINQGTMRASNGGVLQLDGLGGGNFINTGGLIEAQTGSTVRLTNATVIGGTLSTSGTGLISVDANSNSILENLTIAGNLEVLNNTDLGLTGTINNTGSIAVSNLNNLTDIEVQAGGATLTGGGTITLQGSSNNSRVMGVAGSPTLTIADQTIQGRGHIGANSLGIANGANGVIHANSTGNTLTVDPSSSGNFVNQGTLRASGGGELVLTGFGGGAFSGDGTYEALNGGLLRSDSTAAINSLAGGVLTEGTWRAIDGGAGATIRLQNNFLAPTTIGANAAVELSGANSAFTFNATNNSIDSSLNNVQGSLALRNGRVMNLSSGLTNSGDIFLDGAATALTVNGNFAQTGGMTQLVSGATLDLNGATNVFSGGLLAGNGTVDGSFTLGSGAVLSPGLSPGQIDVLGNFIWESGGLIEFDLGSNNLSSDLVDITGNFLKSGTGSWAFSFLDNGMVVGNTYDLIDFSGTTTFALNDFSFTNPSGFDGNFAFGNGGQTLQFSLTAVPEPGTCVLLLVSTLSLVMRRRRSS